ncbi:hypothetical protein [Psychrobacter sp. JCM 18900]|uniref:hypothetical protein n=1 Tax=Psychrobacter sp. JCM 18900 TaxID=1298608 RepID=UPI0004321B67|nr:hypothetical protein [Psychrobacter sp. JCM 18900]GAF53041.1 hypothetical protein JCM18900_11594 [Psychrobacter sp. JCM 18900]
MITNDGFQALTTKTTMAKNAAMSAMLTGIMLAASSANAAPEIAISSSASGSTTVSSNTLMAKLLRLLRRQTVSPCKTACRTR